MEESEIHKCKTDDESIRQILFDKTEEFIARVGRRPTPLDWDQEVIADFIYPYITFILTMCFPDAVFSFLSGLTCIMG